VEWIRRVGRLWEGWLAAASLPASQRPSGHQDPITRLDWAAHYATGAAAVHGARVRERLVRWPRHAR
jgi:hypothetical protein